MSEGWWWVGGWGGGWAVEEEVGWLGGGGQAWVKMGGGLQRVSERRVAIVREKKLPDHGRKMRKIKRQTGRKEGYYTLRENISVLNSSAFILRPLSCFVISRGCR